MVGTSFDHIVQSEFIPREATVNSEYYKSLLQCLWNNIWRKRPENWANDFLLYHNNVPGHTSFLFMNFWERGSCLLTSRLFSTFSTMWLLTLPKSKNCTKRKMFWHDSRHWESHDEAAEDPSERSLPEMIKIM